jgi:hypothetical protein
MKEREDVYFRPRILILALTAATVLVVILLPSLLWFT